MLVNSNLCFCSLFPDTDGIYGSLGNFFQCSQLLGKNIFCNPPYIESLMQQMTERIIFVCNSIDTLDVKIRFFIVVPQWTDALYYNQLLSSKYLKYTMSFEKGKYYFMSDNEKIRAFYDTRLFVMSVGYENVGYADLARFTNELYDKF
jgi:hypothetical protein